jgi:hypothetical protein
MKKDGWGKPDPLILFRKLKGKINPIFGKIASFLEGYALKIYNSCGLLDPNYFKINDLGFFLFPENIVQN